MISVDVIMAMSLRGGMKAGITASSRVVGGCPEKTNGVQSERKPDCFGTAPCQHQHTSSATMRP